MNRRLFTKLALVATLGITLACSTACPTPSWYSTATNYTEVAVSIATQIVSAKKPELAQKAKAVEDLSVTLLDNLNQVAKTGNITAIQAVQATFAALRTNVTELEVAAKTSSNQDIIINAALEVLDGVINSIANQVPKALNVNVKVEAGGTVFKNPDAARKAFNNAIGKDLRFKPLHVGILHRL